MAVVYEHIRNDTNEVFYVGIGNEEKRAFVKCKRNPYWKHIVNKVGHSVNIIHKDIDWEEAKKIEILLIEKYGRKDLGLGNLVNMTDGGEGVLGFIASEETRQKLSEAHKGKTPSEETRQKMSSAKKGNTNMLGKKSSEETRQKMSESKKGNKNINFGKTHSEETRQKMSLVQRTKEGVKGYYFNKSRKKYQAQIEVGGKRIQLGRFDTPEEALQAYQQAKLIYHA
jgi:hypothetical protein